MMVNTRGLPKGFQRKALAAAVAVVCMISSVAVACGPSEAIGSGEGVPMAEKPIEQVLEENTGRLMSIPGVVGTAQGLCSGQPCIKVFVIEKTGEIVEQLPSEIDGYRVEIQETGEFRKLDSG